MGESTNSYRKRVYGVDDSWVETQLIVQGGVCAICRRENPSRAGQEPERLGIDHDHRSGANRGLTCQRCNKTLGFIEGPSGCPLEQSTEYLMRLLIYLREHALGSPIPFTPVGQQSNSLPGSELESSSQSEQVRPCGE